MHSIEADLTTTQFENNQSINKCAVCVHFQLLYFIMRAYNSPETNEVVNHKLTAVIIGTLRSRRTRRLIYKSIFNERRRRVIRSRLNIHETV